MSPTCDADLHEMRLRVNLHNVQERVGTLSTEQCMAALGAEVGVLRGAAGERELTLEAAADAAEKLEAELMANAAVREELESRITIPAGGRVRGQAAADSHRRPSGRAGTWVGHGAQHARDCAPQ